MSKLSALQDDLPNKAVSQQEVERFAKDNGFIEFAYVSVKDNKKLAESVW